MWKPRRVLHPARVDGGERDAAPAEIISAWPANFLPRPLHLHEPLPYTYGDRSIAREPRPRSLAACVRCMHDHP